MNYALVLQIAEEKFFFTRSIPEFVRCLDSPVVWNTSHYDLIVSQGGIICGLSLSLCDFSESALMILKNSDLCKKTTNGRILFFFSNEKQSGRFEVEEIQDFCDIASLSECEMLICFHDVFSRRIGESFTDTMVK